MNARLETTALIDIFRHHRARLLGVALLMFATMAAGVALIGVSAWFLTGAALAGSLVGFNLFAPSAGIRGLTLTRILSRYAEKLVGHDAMLRIARDLRVWFFARALPLANGRFAGSRTGDLLAQVTADVDNVDGLFLRAIGPALAVTAMTTMVLVFVFATLPSAAWMLLAGFLATLALAFKAMHGAVADAETERARHLGELRAHALTGIEAAGDLDALGASNEWLQRFESHAQRLAMSGTQRKRWLADSNFIQMLVGGTCIAVVAWLALDACTSGVLSGTRAAMLAFLGLALVETWGVLVPAGQAAGAGRASIARLRALVEQAPDVCDAATPRPFPARTDIRFERVAFGYPGGSRHVLDGVDIGIAAGHRIRIAGDSGTGKSTLARLLLRTADPDAGRIAIGGMDIRDLSLKELHAHIAYLSQHTPVFAGTVRDNLRLGAPAADDARLWRALDQVRLSDKVRGMTNGLDGWVGENGLTLSAGEGRRLALARALLRDAPILLLDEPTEGLDHATAMDVLSDLARHIGNCSLILITHGSVPAGLIDRSYLLTDGQLREA